MSNQVKGDSFESQQLRKGGRGGGASAYRASQPSAKAGGAGGFGPSATAPPHTNSINANHPRPSAPGNGAGRRKPNGHWQPSNVANGETQGKQPPQSPAPAPAPRRPISNNNGHKQHELSAPIPPKETVAGSQPMFQFGSINPSFVVPPRTTSAPPNLDEQKREQAHYDAIRANKVVPLVPRMDAVHMPTMAPPQPVRPLHMMPMVKSQPQHLQQPVLPHGIVQPAFPQGGKYQQPPPVMGSQVATPMMPPQPLPQMGHQMGPAVPMQFHPPQFFPTRSSKAVKIVNPETQEEVRFDAKNSTPVLPSAPRGPPPQIRANYTVHPPASTYQQQPPVSIGTPFYPGAPIPYQGAYGRGSQVPPTGPKADAGVQLAANGFSKGAQQHMVSRQAVPSVDVAEAQAVVPPEAAAPTAFTDNAGGKQLSVEPQHQAAVEDVPDTAPVEEVAKEPSVLSPPEPQPVDEQQKELPAVNIPEVRLEEALSESAERTGSADMGELPPPAESKGVAEAIKEPVEACVEPMPADETQTPKAVVEKLPKETSNDVVNEPDMQEETAVAVESKQDLTEKKDQALETPKASYNPGNKKKNKKKMFAKADAAGSTSDLYNAYKAPDEKKQEEALPQEVQEVEDRPATEEQVPEVTAAKEVDDWEDAADLPTPSPSVGDDSRMKYTRDFLLTFRDQHMELPFGFEARPDVVELLLVAKMKLPPMTPSGRHQDVRVELPQGHMMGGFRPLTPGMMPTMRYPPGMTPRGVDADRWVHQKGLIPSPQTNLPAIHKAEKKYEVGKITDDEQAKQRQINSILNKLTPQNFEKLFGQVKDVGIETASTLTGVISQIFDKAVMEPTFCETYARFCVQLSVALPEFLETGEKITFKRVLLNKCQEEFERGKREEEEAGKAEEGEPSVTPELREEKRVKARRRMLGNIRFIGELYKNSMLTERIMHECIKTLLGEYQNPDEEDVEALCKLMTTIGQLIDHPKAKAHMDAYFDRIRELSNNPKLSSRLRFGLKDVIDLRRNGWQQRRKVEGPKKIEEVHRDAAQERAQSTRDSRFSRGSGSRRMPQPSVPMGASRGMPSRMHQDVRMEEPYMPMPVSHRPAEDITLGPQGGLGRGPVRAGSYSVPSKGVDYSRRPLTAPSMERSPYGAREDFSSARPGFGPERPLLERPERFAAPRPLERSSSDRLAGYSVHERPVTPPTPAPQPAAAPVLTEEQLNAKSDITILEYYSARDLKEAAQCVEELKRPDYHPAMVSRWLSGSFEKKQLEREHLVKLLIHLQSLSSPVVTVDHLRQGFVSILSAVEDLVMDVPKAPEYVGSMLGALVASGVFPLAEISKLVKEGGAEKDSLLESGNAVNVLASLLDAIRHEKDEKTMVEMYTSAKLNIEEFVFQPRPGEIETMLRRKNLVCLRPMITVEDYVKDAFAKDQPPLEMYNWLKANASSLFQDAVFQRMMMTEVLNHSVLPLPTSGLRSALEGRTRKYAELLKKLISLGFKAESAAQRQYILAIQQFAHAHNHPAGLMTSLFSNLYSDDVISERAFMQWLDDVNDASPGRAQAVAEVKGWLDWLASAPEEEEADE